MTLIGIQLHDPNWDAFAHAAHASQLGSCNYNMYMYLHVHVHVHWSPGTLTTLHVLHVPLLEVTSVQEDLL